MIGVAERESVCSTCSGVAQEGGPVLRGERVHGGAAGRGGVRGGHRGRAPHGAVEPGAGHAPGGPGCAATSAWLTAPMRSSAVSACSRAVSGQRPDACAASAAARMLCSGCAVQPGVPSNMGVCAVCHSSTERCCCLRRPAGVPPAGAAIPVPVPVHARVLHQATRLLQGTPLAPGRGQVWLRECPLLHPACQRFLCEQRLRAFHHILASLLPPTCLPSSWCGLGSGGSLGTLAAATSVVLCCIQVRVQHANLNCWLNVQSVAVAPFIINYSGCIFREYPGPWQVCLHRF